MAYRANHRLIQRGPAGRFRQTTMTDIGMVVCEKCGQLFAPDYADLAAHPIMDPREFNRRGRFCGGCGGQGTDTGLYATEVEAVFK